MPKPILRKTPLIVLLIILALRSVAQPEPADTIKHFYSSFTPGLGVGFQWSGHMSGMMSISLPYTVTDGSGQTTSATFQSSPKKIYQSLKTTVLPFMLEFGGLRHTFNFGLTIPIEDDFTGGIWLTAGYGFNWFLSGWRHHRSDPLKKAFVIKAALNVLYDWDMGNGAAGTFGTIDNTGKVIHLLGQTADSIFTEKRYRRTATDTYNAKNCTLHFAQRELALMPRIILSNNPFVGHAHAELILGYTFPLMDIHQRESIT